MKNIWPVKIAFAVILIIGIWLRFDRLTSIPPSLSHDETAITYNAYSILKTGKDEYGMPYPILFRSFDDYKLPGMVYSTVPMVALFGLSELSARLPSAVFGVLSIIVMFGIGLEVFRDKRKALIPMFMFAVQPWHINFSRQLFESNGAVFWFMLGTYFLLKSTKKYVYIFFAGLSFVAALYFYYSVRLVIPFVGLFYLIYFRKTAMKEMRTTLLAAAVCLLAFLPLGKEMISPGGMERISIVSVVNDQNYLALREAYVKKMGTTPTIVQKIIYNRRVALVKTVFDNYAKNISPHNLFVTGTGTYGTLYPFEAILVPLGFVALTTLTPFAGMLICIWILTAFLPGAFSLNQPNTLRTLIAAPAFALLSGMGLLYAIQKVRRNLPKWATPIAILLMTIMFIIAFPNFHYAYFVNNPTKNALSFGDGYKQMVSYVKAHEYKYDRIVISGYYWRPYIFMLYWSNTDPGFYQKSGRREQFGKYVFSAASWDTNGHKFMDPKFDFASLNANGRTLFILAKPEYVIHQKQFEKISDISGMHTPWVFTAALLKK